MWLADLDCRNSPFPVDGVISAVQQAVNSPVPCSYRNLRPPVLERKRAWQVGGFKLQVWFLNNIRKTHIYRHSLNVSGKQLWLVHWPSALFPVHLEHLDKFHQFGRENLGLTFDYMKFGCVLPFCDHHLNLVHHSFNFWDTGKGDDLIWWATWINQFQRISFTSNQHTATRVAFSSQICKEVLLKEADEYYSFSQHIWESIKVS